MESQGIGSCSNIDGLHSACALKKMQQDLPVHVYGVGGGSEMMLSSGFAERGNLREGKDKVSFEHCKFSMAIRQIETLSKCITLDATCQSIKRIRTHSPLSFYG